MVKNRDVGLDITRIIAFAFVPAIHFFMNSGYYETPVVGERMYIMTAMRTLFGVCVPLFMLLSGYLMIEKEVHIEKRELINYYKKLSKVLETYFLSTMLIMLFKFFRLHEELHVKDVIFNVTGYGQYSWYVNMYIGLYLLIPLLNVLWRNIGDKWGHKVLVAVSITLTVGPSVFNVFDFYTPGALIRPWLTTSFNQLVPNWWSQIYPITYYFIGCYIKEYINIKSLDSKKLFFLLGGMVTVFSLNNIWRSYSINFVRGSWCDWGSLQNTVNTVLIFLLINSIHYSLGSKGEKIVKLISNLTFGAYILSWIPDNYIYPQYINVIPEMQHRLNYFFIAVGGVIVSSILLSLFVQTIIKLLERINGKIKVK